MRMWCWWWTRVWRGLSQGRAQCGHERDPPRPDPLFGRIPVRGYRTAQAIQCNAVAGLRALREALRRSPTPSGRLVLKPDTLGFLIALPRRLTQHKPAATSRGWRVVSRRCWATVSSLASAGALGRCLTCRRQAVGSATPRLAGWAGPHRPPGFQLANRDRLVVCVVGDGSYLFANPVACHQVAAAQHCALDRGFEQQGWTQCAQRLTCTPTVRRPSRMRFPLYRLRRPQSLAPSRARVPPETVERARLTRRLGARDSCDRDEQRQVLLDVKIGLDDGEK